MDKLAELPRVGLVAAPTPLQPAARLSAELGVDVWFKREDLTGLGLGGNKLRGLEYLIGDARSRGCDQLVTGGGAQSNWAMLAALTARRAGLSPHLVFYGTPPEQRPDAVGNLLLDRLLEADIRFTGSPERASVDAGIDALVAELRDRGGHPYQIPRGGANVLGACGYVQAGRELARQLEDCGLGDATVWLATGSCGTQAGLVAAAAALARPFRVIGVTTSRPVDECLARIADLAGRTADFLGLPTPAGPATVLDGYLGPGYGLPSAPGTAATRLVAQLEGVLLDPVFGAKAMAALIDAARDGAVAGPVVFLVGGGTATLFAGLGAGK